MFESKCTLVVTGQLLLVVMLVACMLVVCVGGLGMAASYARHSASYHKNQHKAMQSRAALAVCLASWRGDVLATKQPAAVASTARSPAPVLAPNTILEQQHRRLLNAMNEGDIGTIKQMLADDIKNTGLRAKQPAGVLRWRRGWQWAWG